MDAIIKGVIKYVKTHLEPFRADSLAEKMGASVELVERAVAQLAYLGIVEIDERDGRIYSLYETDFIVKSGTLVKYIGCDEHVKIPEGVRAVGLFSYKPSDIEYGVPNIWSWAGTAPKIVEIPSTVEMIAKDAFLGFSGGISVVCNAQTRSRVAFTKFCTELCSDKYLGLFSDKGAELTVRAEDGEHIYVGAAKEFCDYFCDGFDALYSAIDLNNHALQDEINEVCGKFDYVLRDDGILEDEDVSGFSSAQIVGVIRAAFHISEFDTGFIQHLASLGYMAKLLTRLKFALSEENE